MSKAAQPSDSAPETFEQYRSLKSAAVADAPSTTEEAAPASEPDIDKQEPPKPTDEEKAERKRRNDERRERRWFEERGAMRAEMRELRERLERAEAQREQSPAKATENAKPTLDSFLNSGKYKTYEAAQEAFTDALTDWKLAQREAERESREAKSDEREVQTAFQKDVKQFSKTHDDFDELFEVVKDRLDSDALYLSDVIVRSENPAQLIHYLGSNEEEMDRLLELSPQRAMLELGKIAARLEGKKEKEAPAKEPTVTGKPKAPKSVSGRGSVVSREERMLAAAEAKDFTAFQAASRAKD